RVLHRAETLEHLDDPEELLPVRVAEGLQHLALLAELPVHPIEALPGLLAAVLRAPRAAVALDGRERAFGAVALLALDQVRHREPSHLLGEPAGALLPVARHVQRRGLPEHPLDVALLHGDR